MKFNRSSRSIAFDGIEVKIENEISAQRGLIYRKPFRGV